MKKNLLFSLLFLAWLGLQAQQIENVTAAQQGKNILVSYDLTASSGEFDVSLYCSTDGGSTFGNPLYSVTGDVGKSIKSGYNKQITWNVLTDREKLAGNRIVFEVRAKPINTNVNDFGIEMVFVKGGTFTMGSNDGESDEKPAHQVTLSDFYIGKYEVTQKQWREIMGASASLSDPSRFTDCDDCPIENISWNDVQEFIKKLNQKTGKTYRLPTEAEWEYAARGGSKPDVKRSRNSDFKYSGSNNIQKVAWFIDNSGRKTQPIGQKKPNELGIYDMTGNVDEWCSDWYGSDYYKNSPAINPKGPASGDERVVRGGAWNCNLNYCRVASRDGINPNFRHSSGFRFAHDN